MSRLLALPLLLASGLAGAAATQPIAPGQTAVVTLQGSGFTNALVLNVPEGVERLRLRATAANPATDIDLLVRYGSPFPDTTFDGAPPSPGYLFDHAVQLSANAEGDEFIVLSSASGVPLRAGPVHISLLNFDAAPATITFSSEVLPADFFVPITVVFNDTRGGCDVAGWNDAAAASPVRGNSGTTLGQQRRNALNEAARLLSEELRPIAPLTVQACWDTLEFGDNGGTLAQAGPYYRLVRDAGRGFGVNFLPERFVTFPGTVSAHQAGNNICRYAGGRCAEYLPDVFSEFNYAVDQSSNANRRFDYGFEAQPGTTSFISVAMHEIAHGLGFAGSLDLSSSSSRFGDQRLFRGLPYDDTYGNKVRSSVGGALNPTPFLRLDNGDRLNALVSTVGLRFGGPITLSSPDNPFSLEPSPGNHLALHAPSPVAPGSTYSHLSTLNNAAGPQLMTASINASGPRSLGLGRLVLQDIGWYRSTRAPSPALQISEGQYFDPKRNGHGFEIRRIAGFSARNGDPLYFVTFYTYDGDGRPEFFTATGTLVEGVFSPAQDATTGDSLLRNLYLGRNSSPQTQADPSPDYDGQVRIDFGNAANHPACFTSAEGRNFSSPMAVLSFSINADDETQWCVEALTDPAAAPQVDFSNQWYDPADGGWGLSIVSVPGNGGDALALEIYYPDAQGRGRWGLVQTDRYEPGAPMPVVSFDGFCRECEPSELEAVQIGEMVLNLRRPGEGPSTVSFDVTWPGAEGGRFTRTNSTIIPVGTPGF
ncbi:hypothetical protein [Pseudomarimonas salicorniae]|uniref:IPT/TIG domain-containing protein n=1 Tax=Pseudomarimonas salicorniae TaxID=2933270 RepID=A0ABT0GDG4_9GAMM|nr:hypothetical protein [Lysobacter sp. CAU 1642]MCK7592582.1 hypothetical protein [Lysobacter sp. CAU 1642]